MLLVGHHTWDPPVHSIPYLLTAGTLTNGIQPCVPEVPLLLQPNFSDSCTPPPQGLVMATQPLPGHSPAGSPVPVFAELLSGSVWPEVQSQGAQSQHLDLIWKLRFLTTLHRVGLQQASVSSLASIREQKAEQGWGGGSGVWPAPACRHPGSTAGTELDLKAHWPHICNHQGSSECPLCVQRTLALSPCNPHSFYLPRPSKLYALLPLADPACMPWGLQMPDSKPLPSSRSFYWDR